MNSSAEAVERNPALPPYAAALRRALRRAVRGQVRFSPGERAMYAYDASIFRQVPIGVVLPVDAADVEAAVAVCRDFSAPILPRGCGTGLAGQSVNAAVVLDFSRHMTAIESLDPDRRRARVQPGVICDSLRRAAAEHGLTYAADPATHDHATFGGMVGNNTCGTHSLTGGKTVDNIEELEVLTYDGLRLRVGATPQTELEAIIAAGGRRGAIYAGLRHLRDTYATAIRAGFPRIPRRVSGYNLDSLLPENGFHVARALVGSEGTCAVTLEATARLVPCPPCRALVVLGYPHLADSGDDVPWALQFGPIACEFTSRHVVENMHDKGLHFGGARLLPEGDAWLLLEFGGQTQDEANAAAERVCRALEGRRDGPAYRLLTDPAGQSAVWEVRRHSAGTSRRPVGLGGHGGWPNWEDAAVAPDRLGDYLRGFTALLDRYGYDAVLFGHWGQGCVHARIDFDLRSAAGVRTYRRFMEEAADLVVSFGGSLSGEHGDGHGRAELWPKMFSPELMAAMTAFKRLWDPDNRMNPHKLIDPFPLDAHLREGPAYSPARPQTVFAFPADGRNFAEAAGRCFGVGKCRHVDGGVMCPSFMVTREERHSTRGRARLLQEMLDSDGPMHGAWRDREVKEALDLCLACKGCRTDCPAQVDMATYKAEFYHHYYAGRLRPRQAYALGLIPRWARAAHRVPRLTNAATHARGLSTMVKLAAGVAASREAPRFAGRSFTDWFAAHPTRRRAEAPVLLWPDTFTNYFAPQVGVAAVEVLEAAGFAPVLPARPLCCGRPLYDYGMLRPARRWLREILAVLEPHLRAGTPLVGLEPSCLAVFRDELTNLFPNDLDAARLKAASFTLAEFLRTHAADWPLPRLERRALVQPHCHHHAVLGFDADRELMSAMGLEFLDPDAGCCGMAGSFGYEAGERHRVSMAAGERKLLPAVRAADAETLILADGFSCRSQIAGGTDRRGLHLAEVLALAIRQGRAGPLGRLPEQRVPGPEITGRRPLRAGAWATGAAVAAVGAGLANRFAR